MSRWRPFVHMAGATSVAVALIGCGASTGHAHDADPGIPVNAGDGVQGSISHPACSEPKYVRACNALLVLDRVASETTAYYQLKKRDLGGLTSDGAVQYVGSFWDQNELLGGTEGSLDFSMVAAGFTQVSHAQKGDTMTLHYRGGGQQAGVTVTATLTYVAHSLRGPGVVLDLVGDAA